MTMVITLQKDQQEWNDYEYRVASQAFSLLDKQAVCNGKTLGQ